MKLLYILLLTSCLYGITAYDITNQNYNLGDVSKFIKKHKNNKLTDSQIYMLFWQCRAFQINYLYVCAIMEKETSLISNPESIGKYKWREHRCMGYQLIQHTKSTDGHKYYRYGHYDIQVHSGVKCIRKWFDDWYEKNYKCKTIQVDNKTKKIDVNNVSDYILYRYTPFTVGVNNFKKIYTKFETMK